MNLQTIRRTFEPALRRVFHLYWRFARGMTLGVRGVVLDAGNRVFLVKHSYVSGWHLPGGGVEVGENLHEAVAREVREETGLAVAPVALAGYREAIARDQDGRVERHFVILSFAARWIAGEPVLNDELSEAMWLHPSDMKGLTTTQGLAEIIAAAFALIGKAG